MVSRIYIIFALVVAISCNDKPLECKGIKIDDGIAYYNNSLFTGTCNETDENGKIRGILSYEKGIRHGHWLFYYANGEIETEGSFKKGVREGIWTYYYNNGNIRLIGKYSKGLKDSIWSSYDKNKNLLFTDEYN